ncbi:helix-turn-helix domain-containing protein [Streptomyces sp. NPDC055103]
MACAALFQRTEVVDLAFTSLQNALECRLLTACERSGEDAPARLPDSPEAVRPLTVSALVDGRDRVEVATLFKVPVRAVDNWWAKWQAGGRDVPLPRPRGRRAGEHQVLSGPSRTPPDRRPSITSPPAWDFRAVDTGADRRTDLQAVPGPFHRA